MNGSANASRSTAASERCWAPPPGFPSGSPQAPRRHAVATVHHCMAVQVLNVLPEDPELQLNLARQIIHHSLTSKARYLHLLTP